MIEFLAVILLDRLVSSLFFSMHEEEVTYNVSEEEITFTVSEEMFNHLRDELKKTKEELIEAKLDIWEWEFDKEHVKTLEEVVHEQKVENEELQFKIQSLKTDIQNYLKELDEKTTCSIDQLDKIDRLNRQMARMNSSNKKYMQKYYTERQLRKQLQKENEELKKQEENDLNTRICKKLQKEEPGFEIYWRQRFTALLAEIDIKP